MVDRPEVPHAAPADLEAVSVSSSVARGGAWSFGGQIVGFGTALVATPFTIRLLGPARYGLWAILQTVLSWVALADLGMADASTRFAGEGRARGDATGEAMVIWTAAAITVCITGLASALLALAAPFVLSHLLHVPHRLLGTGTTALRLICVGCVATALGGTLNTPQVVRLNWRSYTLVTTGTSVVQVIAIPISLAALGGGLITAAAISLGAALAAVMGTGLIALRLQPAVRHPTVSRSLAKRMLRFGGPLTISGFAAIPLTSGERFLLAHYTTPVTVAYYIVASRLATLISAIPGAVTGPLFPALVGLEKSGDLAGARALYRQALQGSFLVLTPIALLVAFLANPFLTAWAGPTYGRHSALPFYVLVLGVWFNSLAWIPGAYLLSTDRTPLIARIHLLELLPYLALAALLTSNLGALGAAIVWSGRLIVDSVVFFWAASRGHGSATSPLPRRGSMSLLAPATLAAALATIAFVSSSLLVRLGSATLLGSAYFLVTWFAVLTGRERVALRALVNQIGPHPRRTRSASA